jgi:hypothetical protein
MVAVAVGAVVVEAVGAVGVMVILTMGLVVVITATVAREAIDGNGSLIGRPILRVAPYYRHALARSADLLPICAPLTHPLRPQIVAVSIRVE